MTRGFACYSATNRTARNNLTCIWCTDRGNERSLNDRNGRVRRGPEFLKKEARKIMTHYIGRFAALLAALCVFAWLVLGTNRDLSPNPAPKGAGPEPNAHHSYVRSALPCPGTGMANCIVASDAQYTVDI